MAIEPGTQPEFANVIAPGVAAPHHQHLFNVRLDLDLDGVENEVYEVEAESVPFGDDNPWGNAFRPKTTLLSSESEAQRKVERGDAAGRGRSSTRTCRTGSASPSPTSWCRR